MSIPVFKSDRERFSAIVERAVPSQLPFNVDRASYDRMLKHCHTDFRSLWCCSKTNARVKARVTYRTVYNRDNTINAVHIPVAVLFCAGCDETPKVRGEDPIYADQVGTYSV